jgi:Putative Ig domain/Protein of unknown function (DUF1573)
MISITRSHGLVCSVAFLMSLGLWGTKVQARSAVSTTPSSMSFGAINVNSLSSPQAFTVTNTEDESVTIARVTSSSSQFTVSGPALPLILQPGQDAVFQVVFGPTSSGSFSGTINIRFNRFARADKTISVSGTGVAVTPLAITTTSLANGQVGVAYSTTLGASGGTTPYTWSLSSGALPGGLALSTAGTISGTPTTAGSFSFTVMATVSTTPTAQTTTKSFTITVAAAVTPVQITTTSIPAGQVGTAYSTTLAATGGTTPYSWSVASGALPAGLGLSASGTISGTPTASGSFSFTAKVTDSTTPTAQASSQSLTITIAAAVTPVQITTTSILAGQVGTAYSTTLAASGGTTPYSWSVASGALPAGLTLAATGTISGTPSASGSFSFTAKVTDSTTPTAQTATKSFTLTVAAAVTPVQITTTSVASGQVGTAYSATLTASGGTTPYNWSVSAGGLPAGLTLSAAGTVSGTPTASGSFSFTAKVTDSTTPTAQTATQAFTMTIAAAVATLRITSTTIPAGQVGAAYSTLLQGTGGTTPYSWSLGSGVLPAGLSLSTSGTLSGTPTTAGSFTFTIKVTDSTTPTAQTATQSLTFTVAAAATPVEITSTSVPAGQVGVAYSTTLQATNGTSPYSWSVSSGTLPAGLTLSTAGVISGTPTTSGSSTFTVKVTDSGSPATTATASFSITVSAASGYSVVLTWTASTSSGVTGYNVYRSTVNGSGYAKINASPVAGLTYTDTTVTSGQTYYYVTTSVDDSGDESAYSEVLQMVIP